MLKYTFSRKVSGIRKYKSKEFVYEGSSTFTMVRNLV